MQDLDKTKLDLLEEAIKDAGKYATDMQSKVKRMYKADGSVLTEVDLEISHRILSKISSLFPECAIVSEEEITPHKSNAPFTFVLDPIDGTDIYSLGLPSFAIALGILDENKRPVGAMINAPRFGIARPDLFIRLDPNGELLVDGEKFIPEKKEFGSMQVAFGSKIHKEFDFTSFKGKVRTFGSSVIHLLLPSLIDKFNGAVIEPCFVWDITSSHAILLKTGQDIEYFDGEKFEYTDDFIWNKIPFKKPIIAGNEEFRSKISNMLKPL